MWVNLGYMGQIKGELIQLTEIYTHTQTYRHTNTHISHTYRREGKPLNNVYFPNQEVWKNKAGPTSLVVVGENVGAE